MVKLEQADQLMLARQLPTQTVALILAGGRGTRHADRRFLAALYRDYHAAGAQ